MPLTLDAEVARLTQAGASAELADALVRRAAERLQTGQLVPGARDLADAASLHQIAGRRDDEARCTLGLATALRASGELDDAIAAAERANELAPPQSMFAVAVHTELGEIRLLQGEHDAAIAAYRSALDGAINLPPMAQAALWRRIAFAHALAGRSAEAGHASQNAAHLLPDGPAATITKIEAASALAAAGLAAPAAKAIADARAAAGDDPAALAELALLETARAVEAGDAASALTHAREARQLARMGDSVLAYVGAAIAIADLLERAGDREGAYDSLAVGWVTAGDRIGEDAAAALFRPKLADLRASWGSAAFEAVKTAYYAKRAR